MKVLIAEDDPVSQVILQRTLEGWGYQVSATEDGERALEILLEADGPRLAILDWMMPGLDGPQVCRRVREAQRDDAPYTYLVLLTAMDATRHLVAGLVAGADDFVSKPFDKHELRARVRTGQRIVQLHCDLLEAKAELQRQSITDSLTGARSRRAILRRLGQELARVERERGELSLAMLDLDHFKRVNDAHGHLAGDAVLREAVERMHEVVRNYDLLGRFGGEEFVVVLPGAGPAAALAVGERLRLALAERPMRFQERSIPVTTSIGIASWQPGVGVDQLVGWADAALYRAKEAGRNQVLAHDPQPEGDS